MNKIIINDGNDLAREILGYLSDHECIDDFGVVADYYTICDLLNGLIKDDNNCYNAVSVDLHDPEYDNYDDAYYLEGNVNTQEIYVGKMICEGHDDFLIIMGDVIFIDHIYLDQYMESKNSSKNLKVFAYADDEYDHADYAPCFCWKDEDHKGFSFCVDNDHDHVRIKYEGTKTLTTDEAYKIIDSYFD